METLRSVFPVSIVLCVEPVADWTAPVIPTATAAVIARRKSCGLRVIREIRPSERGKSDNRPLELDLVLCLEFLNTDAYRSSTRVYVEYSSPKKPTLYMTSNAMSKFRSWPSDATLAKNALKTNAAIRTEG